MMAGKDQVVNMIVAVCQNMGIGYKGELPWRLKNEMKYFSQMTKRTGSHSKKNAVIMGRKTWFSIPQKNRPLPDRINIVLSRTLKEKPDGAHYLCHNISEAIQLLSENSKLGEGIETLWAIGGSSVYKEIMKSNLLHRIYLTRIMANYECDTFFPEIDNNDFQMTEDPNVPAEIQEENGIQYKYEIYEKIKKRS